MKPENARVWRKAQRTAAKGIPAGRRTTHKVETQKPDNTTARDQEWRRRRAGLPLWPLDTSDGA